MSDAKASTSTLKKKKKKPAVPQQDVPNIDQSSLEHLEQMIRDGETALDPEALEKLKACYRFIVENKDSSDKSSIVSQRYSTKFRQSGHLIDQTLKYKNASKQLTLFDLLDETKEKIGDSLVEVKALGIRLSASEDKMLKALSKILYERQNPILNSGNFKNANSQDFPFCSYGGKEQKAAAPILRISPATLYKAYLDSDDYSGADIKFINKTLFELSRKVFLIVYDRKRTENGKKVTDRIEDYQSLVKIMSYIEGLSESELEALESGDTLIREKKNELIIGLNPIFVDQINTKYIEFPSDINKRTTIAAGGPNLVSDSTVILRDYMLRELSAGRLQAEINEESLPLLLRLDRYIEQRKKSLVAKRISSAINTVKNLGIISSFKIIPGADGQKKYVFTLNKNFE